MIFKEVESNDPVNSLPANSQLSVSFVGTSATAAVVPVINKQIITDQLSGFRQTLQDANQASDATIASSQKILLHLVTQKQKDIVENKKTHLPQEVKLICHEFERILVNTPDIQEKKALIASLQIEHFEELLGCAFDVYFSQALEQQFLAYLSPAQSKLLAARLSSRLKRMLQKMQSWDAGFWVEFEVTLHKLGVWEQENVPLPWLVGKPSESVSEKTVTQGTIHTQTLDDLLTPTSHIQDKIQQLKQLSQTDDFRWNGSHSSKSSLEVRRLLAALSRTELMQQFIRFVFAIETWERIPELLQKRLYQIFALYADTDLDTIQEQFMAGVSEDQTGTALAMMLQMELANHKILRLFKQDPCLSFIQALDTLCEQQQAIQSRTDAATENSSLSYFQKYRQA